MTRAQYDLAMTHAMLRAWGREQRKRAGIPPKPTPTGGEGSAMEHIDELSKHILTAEVTDIAEGMIKTVNLFLSFGKEAQSNPKIIEALSALGINLGNPHIINSSVPEAEVVAYLRGMAPRPDHIRRVRP